MHDESALEGGVRRVLVVVDRGVRCRQGAEGGVVRWKEGDGGESRSEVLLEDGVGLFEAVEGAFDRDPLAGERMGEGGREAKAKLLATSS